MRTLLITILFFDFGCTATAQDSFKQDRPQCGEIRIDSTPWILDETSFWRLADDTQLCQVQRREYWLIASIIDPHGKTRVQILVNGTPGTMTIDAGANSIMQFIETCVSFPVVFGPIMQKEYCVQR